MNVRRILPIVPRPVPPSSFYKGRREEFYRFAGHWARDWRALALTQAQRRVSASPHQRRRD